MTEGLVNEAFVRERCEADAFAAWASFVALPQNSPLRKPINKALLELMKTNAWTELRNRYME